ncbi:MAG: preprotein translocase subunit SecG [Sphingobacteriia bacterium]|jgi:preprotein translocase subunit SecG|nr:preprotein translocase subunit SecG [Paludibacteraceae bacterium]NCA79267.1 preprotein translocase subunit SecG [Sphingobacteriia bacterium]
MYTLLIILIVIAAVLLTLLVLVQNSKGGGLASGFSSSNQIMGVRKTTDFLEKSTWTLIAIIVVLSIVASGVSKRHSATKSVSAISTEAIEKQAESSEQPMVNFDETAPAEENLPVQ